MINKTKSYGEKSNGKTVYGESLWGERRSLPYKLSEILGVMSFSSVKKINFKYTHRCGGCIF